MLISILQATTILAQRWLSLHGSWFHERIMCAPCCIPWSAVNGLQLYVIVYYPLMFHNSWYFFSSANLTQSKYKMSMAVYCANSINTQFNIPWQFFVSPDMSPTRYWLVPRQLSSPCCSTSKAQRRQRLRSLCTSLNFSSPVVNCCRSKATASSARCKRR